ncbi:MAG: oxidoreductase [Flavobacterium sp. 38-13]|uniref:SDR family NAD(P)-dependent oxidoreductase n=1 Tax=Flavobacterium sp. 38-13 TaxID=1896168 RepID=UPI00095C623F|nr:SDR family oxidoreductase [Flavobacterium sp. 38-13]OJX49766.1 MAG: oxidoreductase [Flavobacterium sp. 38-13]
MQETVLITGATSGIGLELAKLFAADGYRLVIVARDVMELAATAQMLRDRYAASVVVISKDLFEPAAGFELYQELKDKEIRIDVLVNDAGQGQYGLFVETDVKRQLDIIQLNISSLVVLTHLFLKDMVAAGRGKILNLSSIASKAPGPWQAVYHGTKAFVQSFTEAIRSEVKDRGITVTALLPGVTDTDFFNKADMNSSKAVQDKDDMADPADVARDGYEALMRGDDKIVSGFKNKLQVAMNNLATDQMAAEQMKDFQEPVDKAEEDGHE